MAVAELARRHGRGDGRIQDERVAMAAGVGVRNSFRPVSVDGPAQICRAFAAFGDDRQLLEVPSESNFFGFGLVVASMPRVHQPLAFATLIISR